MSLDVYLHDKRAPEALPIERIFVRRDGETVEVSREEWAESPSGERFTVTVAVRDEVYTANITHNLAGMASEAGIYEALWRPEDVGATKGRDLAERLRDGLLELRANRERYEQYNPKNGWGNYDLLVRYLAACEGHPDAEIGVSR